MVLIYIASPFHHSDIAKRDKQLNPLQESLIQQIQQSKGKWGLQPSRSLTVCIFFKCGSRSLFFLHAHYLCVFFFHASWSHITLHELYGFKAGDANLEIHLSSICHSPILSLCFPFQTQNISNLKSWVACNDYGDDILGQLMWFFVLTSHPILI